MLFRSHGHSTRPANSGAGPRDRSISSSDAGDFTGFNPDAGRTGKCPRKRRADKPELSHHIRAGGSGSDPYGLSDIGVTPTAARRAAPEPWASAGEYSLIHVDFETAAGERRLSDPAFARKCQQLSGKALTDTGFRLICFGQFFPFRALSSK